MAPSLLFTYTACGIFLLTGLISGVWKYYHIHSSKEAQAPVYVDIAHRTSLMYSFASLVLVKFVELSPYSETVTFWSAAAPIVFFALAISTYVIHGILKAEIISWFALIRKYLHSCLFYIINNLRASTKNITYPHPIN